MCCGRNRLLFSLTSVHPGPNNFNIEIGGAGERLKHILCNRLLYSQHRNPINLKPKKKKQNWERENGTTADNTKPKTKRERESVLARATDRKN